MSGKRTKALRQAFIEKFGRAPKVAVFSHEQRKKNVVDATHKELKTMQRLAGLVNSFKEILAEKTRQVIYHQTVVIRKSEWQMWKKQHQKHRGLNHELYAGQQPA